MEMSLFVHLQTRLGFAQMAAKIFSPLSLQLQLTLKRGTGKREEEKGEEEKEEEKD